MFFISPTMDRADFWRNHWCRIGSYCTSGTSNAEITSTVVSWFPSTHRCKNASTNDTVSFRSSVLVSTSSRSAESSRSGLAC